MTKKREVFVRWSIAVLGVVLRQKTIVGAVIITKTPSCQTDCQYRECADAGTDAR
jgi:hypothetical protein